MMQQLGEKKKTMAETAIMGSEILNSFNLTNFLFSCYIHYIGLNDRGYIFYRYFKT